MNWQYMQLETIARQRHETLMHEAEAERLAALLRARRKTEERRSDPVDKPAWATTRWLGLPRHAS